MPSFDQATMPVQDPISAPRRALPEFRNRPDPLEGLVSAAWLDWLTRLTNVVSQNPTRLNSVLLTGQSASIGATDMSGGALNAGLYRLTYYARITQAAGTSSSLTITLSWTDGGVSISQSGAAMTGNTTSTFQTDSLMFRCDKSSPVRYATTYASAGAPVMLHSLYVTLEQVQA